jgi:hypothetical protein
MKGRKIVIVDRVRDRVGEKSMDRDSCFVIVKQKEPARFETSTHKA